MKRFLFLVLCLLPLMSFAAYLRNIPSAVTQPDGEVLQLFASGDEYANRLHDAKGFTIIQSPTDGFYYYAVERAGEPEASQWRVNTVDPAQMGIPANLTISKAARDRKIQFMKAPEKRNERGPNTGTVNNLNVFIRFSDQSEFALPREYYDAKFNEVGDSAISLRNYYHKVSYNQLNYVTHHYPQCPSGQNLSYQDSHARSYYLPYNAITNPGGYYDSDARANREQTMLANAIAALAPQIPASLNIDADNDGAVDNVCFIIRGPHAAWADLLWAHRWVMYVVDAYINGKQVWDFTFQPEDQNTVDTLCHEMFHSIGAPDLYHYTFNGVTPAGCWDIMDSGNGHMGMYMKGRYGRWINDIPSVSVGNTYTLYPVTSPYENVYRYPIPGNSNQYLVFEYRKYGSDIFEAELPGSGLLIYRIDAYLDGNGEGPPDEVYIFRPNGSTTVNGLIADAAFSADVGQTEFNAFTNPAAFLGNGSPIQININNISAAGETISFHVSAAGDNLAPVISSISPVSGSILANSDFTMTANVSAPNSSVDRVEFRVGSLPAIDYDAPYTMVIDGGSLSLGLHTIEVTVHAVNGMQTSKTTTVNIIDPAQLNWFSWLSAAPLYEEYGRGAIPIKAAVDFDLGTQEYRVKGLKFSMLPDPWGESELAGLVTAKINRFADGEITEETLLDLGYIYNFDYDPDYITTFSDTTLISGQIAVILDLYDYQNILFDNNAPCGHSWLSEPNRTWTDALGRGIVGAAAIQLLLQSPTSAVDEELIPASGLQLLNRPNPFFHNTTISYGIKVSAPTKITIYNLKGQLVKTLVDETKSRGQYETIWNGRDNSDNKVSSGVYYYRLEAGGETKTAKMLLLQ